MLVQQRSPNKETYPGLWDISAAGHVVAGEDSRTAATQEVAEEIGLVVQADELEFLLSWYSSTQPKPGFFNNSFNDLYLLHTDKTINELTPQIEEVSALRYIPISELYQLAQNREMRFVPHPQAYQKLFQIFGLIDE